MPYSDLPRGSALKRISAQDQIAGLPNSEAVDLLQRLIAETRADIEAGEIYKPAYKYPSTRVRFNDKVSYDTDNPVKPMPSTAGQQNSRYPAPDPQKRKFKIKLRVNGSPPSRPRLLSVVGKVPDGCERIVQGLRRNPADQQLLAELRARGYTAIMDPPRVRHRCWCVTCNGGYNKGVECCAVTVRARFGDGGDNSHNWASVKS